MTSIMDGDEESSVIRHVSVIKTAVRVVLCGSVTRDYIVLFWFFLIIKINIYIYRISPRSPEGQSILLTGQADSGSVHDGHELLDVGGQQAVEQLLIPVLQCHQQDIPETEPSNPDKIEEINVKKAAVFND